MRVLFEDIAAGVKPGGSFFLVIRLLDGIEWFGNLTVQLLGEIDMNNFTGAGQIVEANTSMNGDIKVVEVQGGAPGQGIDYLYVTVEAPTAERVLSQDAKQVAWEERKKHGMHNAGIEAAGGPYPVEASTGKVLPQEVLQDMKRRPKLSYRHTFRLTMAVI